MRCDPVEATAPVHGCVSVCGCGTRRTFLKSFGAFGIAAALPAPSGLGGGRHALPSRTASTYITICFRRS